MTDVLWQKPGVEVDAHIQAFLAGEDVLIDREFFLHDIFASRVHAEGLARIEVLGHDELEAIRQSLDALAAEFAEGRFVLDTRYEDGHSAIEAWLTDQLGDAGKKIHTGRSRNDQVLVATRLWLKGRLLQLHRLCRSIAAVALQRAQTDRDLPMPGYTHLQRAVVSSAGMWWSAWAEAFIDNAVRAADARAWLDADPLGTAAGYGVNLPLDRDHTRAALGFARTQVSPIYAQLSRGKYEIAALDALMSATLDLRRLAWDLSLFATSEFGFVRLPAQYQTGSSIMPNKRNPDLIELLRASHAPVSAARSEIEQLLSLPGGYHRDLQLLKAALVRGFRAGLGALALLPDLLQGLDWDAERMEHAIEPSMHATDIAVELSRQGIPFRDAYRQAADPGAWETRTAQASLEQRVSPGGHANLQLERLRARLEHCDLERADTPDPATLRQGDDQ